MNPNAAPQWGNPAPPQQMNTPWNAAPAGGGFGATPQGFGAPQGFGQQMAPAGPATPTGPPISLNPATFTAGGMIDNVVVRFADTRVVMYDYNGKRPDLAPVPAVSSMLTILDARTLQPVVGATASQKIWTVGAANEWAPSADGLSIVPLAAKKGLNQNSNFSLLVQSAVAVGFPAGAFDSGRVDVLNGLAAFVQNRTQAGRVAKKNAATGQDEDNGTLCISEIKQAPQGIQVGAPQAQAQPMQQPPAQAQAPQGFAPPQQQFQTQPQAQPQYTQPPMQQYAQPPAQAMQPQAPQAPAGPDPNTAANLLRQIAGANPTSRNAFNVMLFQLAMHDEPMRNLVSNPQFQASVLGNALQLA